MSTLAIIQARYGSTRFPGKALADLCGKPVLHHVIERARQIRGVDVVTVAIPRTDCLGPLWSCIRAVHPVYSVTSRAENDVLGRFADVAEMFDANTVVRLTADCPLLEPAVCGRLIEEWAFSGYEYGWTDTHTGVWPDGLDCEVFTRESLIDANAKATERQDREHVTPWIRRTGRVFSLPADPAFNDWPKVSIDTPEDLDRVRSWMQQH